MMEFRPAHTPMDPRRIRAIIGAARPMFTGIDWDGPHRRSGSARGRAPPMDCR